MRVVQHSASELHYKFSSSSCATTTSAVLSTPLFIVLSLPLSTLSLSYQSKARSATLLPVLHNIDGDSCCCCCQCLLRQSIESALCSVSASGDSDSDSGYRQAHTLTHLHRRTHTQPDILQSGRYQCVDSASTVRAISSGDSRRRRRQQQRGYFGWLLAHETPVLADLGTSSSSPSSSSSSSPVISAIIGKSSPHIFCYCSAPSVVVVVSQSALTTQIAPSAALLSHLPFCRNTVSISSTDTFAVTHLSGQNHSSRRSVPFCSF